MSLIKKVIATTAMLAAILNVAEASSPSTAIDLNSPDVLLNDAKPKDARAVLFIEPTGEAMKARVTFDPDLVDSLYDRPDHTRFTNTQVQNAVAGLSYLYRRLADVAGSVPELKARLRNFIETGRPLRTVFMLDYTHPSLELSHAANADAYLQLSNALRYQEYGKGEAGDLSREHAARQALLAANQATKVATGTAKVVATASLGGSGETTAVKSTVVSMPSPVVAIDPTSPTVLRDDATLEDAMAVLLVKKTAHGSGVMYDIAFDSSVLLGLIPENTKVRETLRDFDTLLARFSTPDVRSFIAGMRYVYLNVMGHVDSTYDKAAFTAVLNQFNAASKSLVVPFKLNPSNKDNLDFQNPFTGHAEEGRKHDLLIESIKTKTNKFLAPGETRTLEAEYAARQAVIDASGKK